MKRQLLALSVVIGVLVTPSVERIVSAQAAKTVAKTDAEIKQEIRSAAADLNTGTLFVSGFGFGATPKVEIAGIAVGVLSSSLELLLVELPAAVRVVAGTYLLRVLHDSGNIASLDVTIGAVGPKGDQEPQGPPGVVPDGLENRLAALKPQLAAIPRLGTTTTTVPPIRTVPGRIDLFINRSVEGGEHVIVEGFDASPFSSIQLKIRIEPPEPTIA